MASNDFFFVRSGGTAQKIMVDSIVYIESLRNYSKIYSSNAEVMTLTSMRDLEGFLPKDKFMRIHKSYIVALDRIQKMGGHMVYLDKDLFFPIGETFRKDVNSFISKYSIGN
ncbi:LytTR family DNA-binding domain-containing protein [Chitinophagaceae bacterium 26-R-25]|nr:LytTR family DNA-binding domain-containing protein [Chitinophagaceae bacterium 26-R-25]